MKVYIYIHHIIALIISLGQNMGVKNVILPQGLYFCHIIFGVVFVVYPWFPTRLRT